MRTREIARLIVVSTVVLTGSFFLPKISRFESKNIDVEEPRRQEFDVDRFCHDSIDDRSLEMVIEFDVVINRFKLYQNSMQTDVQNDGLRIELGMDGNSELILSRDDGSLFGVKGPTKYEENIIQHVKIHYTDAGQLTYSIGDKSNAVKLDSPLFFQCSKIVFGQGYDQSRSLDGIVRNARVSISARIPVLTNQNLFHAIVGMFWGIFLADSFLRINQEKKKAILREL